MELNTKNHKKNSKRTEKVLKDEAVTSYDGPIRPKINELQLTTVVRYLSTSTAATTNVGGVMQNTFTNTPVGFADWSSLTNTWSQYRVLAMEVKFIPAYENSFPTNTAVGGFLAMIVDRSLTGTVLALSDALQAEGVKTRSINKPLMISTKAIGPDEMAWTTISTSKTYYSIRTSSSPMSISTTYGHFVTGMLVELRSQT